MTKNICFVAQVFLSKPALGPTKKMFGTFFGTHLWFGHNLIASQMNDYIIWSDYDNYIDNIHCEEIYVIPLR